MSEYVIWFLVGLYYTACIGVALAAWEVADTHPDDLKPFPRWMRPFEWTFSAIRDGFRFLDPTSRRDRAPRESS